MNSGETRAKADILNSLGFEYRGENPDTAIYFSDSALNISLKLNYLPGVLEAYKNIGWSNMNLANYTVSVVIANNLIRICDRLLALRNLAERQLVLETKSFALSIIGVVNYWQGNYPEAIKNNLLSLQISESIGSKKMMGASYNNLGTVYRFQENYTAALEYYDKALKMGKETGDQYRVAAVYNNVGNIYAEQGEYSQALNSLNEGLQILKSTGNVKGIAAAYNSIGDVHMKQADYSVALKYYFASLEIVNEIHEKEGLANSYSCIGHIYTRLNEPGKAKYYLQRGLQVAKELGSINRIKKNYFNLAKLDSAEGNYKDAFDNFKNFIIYRDSLLNEENTRKSLQAQMQYDFDKKEANAKAEQQRREFAFNEKAKTQKVIRNVLIVAFFLLVILIFVLINRSKLKRQIEMERIRSRLSRDLHDDIGSTLSSINILSRTAQSNLLQISDLKTKRSLEKINERSQRLLDSMSDIIWNINPGNDTLEEVMSRMREYATSVLEAKNIDYRFDFPAEQRDCTLTMDVKNNIYLIFKEAVNNLSKYSECTKAELSLTFDLQHIILRISDNGKGFPVEIDVKGYYSAISEKGGTSSRGAGGAGLRNMQMRTEEIRGSLRVESVNGKGTLIEVTMPRYS